MRNQSSLLTSEFPGYSARGKTNKQTKQKQKNTQVEFGRLCELKKQSHKS